ncbi:MAG TPA: YbaK/EbsC family protein, partial [Clostridiales bacterium]|nr:YbaK/EbsC family protein [Clostridiales bacterium]
TIFPAAGTGNSAVEFTPDDLARITGGIWVDVTKDAAEIAG